MFKNKAFEQYFSDFSLFLIKVTKCLKLQFELFNRTSFFIITENQNDKA